MAGPLYAIAGRAQWFFQDEWAFLSARDGGSLDGLLRPHNEHWSTLPVISYRLLWNLIGVRAYEPYQALTIGLHLVVALLIRAVMRRSGVSPWIATIGVATCLFYGSGYENIVWAFQIGFLGSLAFGMAHLILADHPQPSRRRFHAGLACGLAALMSSGIGLIMAAITGLALLLAHGLRAAIRNVAALALPTSGHDKLTLTRTLARVRPMDGPQGSTTFFVHVMKTAGTSFAQQLVANFAPGEIYPDPRAPDRFDRYWDVTQLMSLPFDQRRRIRLYHGHLPLAAADRVGADVTLTLLREPVARTISHLRHCERLMPENRGKPLEQIYEEAWSPPYAFRNFQVRFFARSAEEAAGDLTEVIAVDEDRLELAVANLGRITVVGITERYGDFLDEVAGRFGWTVADDRRLQQSTGFFEVPTSLRERIASDSDVDVAFYRRAVALCDDRASGAE